MTCEQLQQSYQQHLVKAGVSEQKAEQAARTLNLQQLQIISEIWQDWGKVVSRLT
jgi:LDH2 family malate/lactate/ureidoglycolate dehydrogenase